MPKAKTRTSDATKARRLLAQAKALATRQAKRRAELDRSDRELEAALAAIRGKPKRSKPKAKRSKSKAKRSKSKGKLTGAAKTAFLRRMALGRSRAAKKRGPR